MVNKAAISPGPPIPPGSPMPHLFVLSPSGLILSHTKQTLMLIRKSTYKIGAVSCKTNPISKEPRITGTPFLTKSYGKMPGFASPKTNPNEPKANPICRRVLVRLRRSPLAPAGSRTNAGPAARKIRYLLLRPQNTHTIRRYGKRPEHQKGSQAASRNE